MLLSSVKARKLQYLRKPELHHERYQVQDSQSDLGRKNSRKDNCLEETELLAQVSVFICAVVSDGRLEVSASALWIANLRRGEEERMKAEK